MSLTRGRNRVYMPAIRAAISVHKRPTSVIMHDDWFGHRDPITGQPRGDKDEWISWDHSLLEAFQTIEDYSDEYGLLAWEREDEAVEVDAVKKIHKFKAAIDRTTKGTEKKPYKPSPGEYFTPSLHSRRKDADGNEVIQSFREWVDKTAEQNSN